MRLADTFWILLGADQVLGSSDHTKWCRCVSHLHGPILPHSDWLFASLRIVLIKPCHAPRYRTYKGNFFPLIRGRRILQLLADRVRLTPPTYRRPSRICSVCRVKPSMSRQLSCAAC